ncbi:MAG: endolytic transglycosylase MltG, partial [Pseudomonadales bacterium]
MKALVAKLLVAVILLALLACAALAYYSWSWLTAPISATPSSVAFELPGGSNITALARKLAQRGVITQPEIWTLYARYTGLAQDVKAGEYALDTGLTPQQWLARLVAGDVITYRVTIVEGSTVAEMLEVLGGHPKIHRVLPELAVEDLNKYLDLPDSQHPEGWFFPDTYVFRKGATDLSILKQAQRRMSALLQREWDARALDLPYKNSYEALVMASIVEKESGRGDERERIAGVFVRRLQKGMRLQTDPTVIYGMGESYDGDLRSRDLRHDTPYNTYVHKGLPPTPIALPGRAAIYAALHPAEGDALYFVAKGDGSHYFSSNLAEHRQAVENFQIKKRAKNYRSAP